MPSIADLPPTDSPELRNLRTSHAIHLWQDPRLSSWADRGSPATLASLVYAKIGSNALQRLNDFRQWPGGWNGGSGEEVAWGTLQNFESFLGHARFRTSNPPSLFLTDSGHLELTWEARDGSEMEIAFSPSGATYFFRGTGDEGNASAAELAAIAGRAAELTM